jgi:hypothetical protein
MKCSNLCESRKPLPLPATLTNAQFEKKPQIKEKEKQNKKAANKPAPTVVWHVKRY